MSDNGYELKDKRDFSSNWNLYRYQPLPSLNLQGAIGKVIPMKKNRQLGLMASLSYRNNWQTQDVRMSRDGYFRKDSDGQLAGYNGRRYGFTANLSGMVGAGLTTAKSKYYYQLLYLSMLDQQFMIGTGNNDPVGEAVGYYDLTLQTNLWQQQLKGEHALGKKGLKLNWAASYLLLDKQKPDNHFFAANYVGEGKDKPGTTTDFTMSNAVTFGGTTLRTWNRAFEKNLSWNADLVLPFAFKLFHLPISNTVKAGYAGWRKDRKFWVFNSFALGGNGNQPMPLSEYFATENIQGILVGRFGDDFPAKNKPGDVTLHAGFHHA